MAVFFLVYWVYACVTVLHRRWKNKATSRASILWTQSSMRVSYWVQAGKLLLLFHRISVGLFPVFSDWHWYRWRRWTVCVCAMKLAILIIMLKLKVLSSHIIDTSCSLDVLTRNRSISNRSPSCPLLLPSFSIASYSHIHSCSSSSSSSSSS